MKQEKPRITDHLKCMIAIASLGEILPKSLDTAFNNDLKKPCPVCKNNKQVYCGYCEGKGFIKSYTFSEIA